MLRIIFRTVLVLTLTFLAIFRSSGTKLSPAYIQTFSYWLLFSGVLAGVFLIYSAVKAVQDVRNRRIHIRDAMLAIVWIIFWILSIGR